MVDLNIPSKVFSSHMPVSEEIDEISKTKLGTHHDISAQIKDLAQKIDRVVDVNMVLQDKVAKLGLLVANMTEKINGLMNEIPGTVESMREEIPEELHLKPLPPSPLAFEEEKPSGSSKKVDSLINNLQRLAEQNSEIANLLKNVDKKMERDDKSTRLRHALNKVI